LSSQDVGGEHLLLGILLEGGGMAAQLLDEAGADLEAVCRCLDLDDGKLRAIQTPQG
jgi:hypothetical protein